MQLPRALTIPGGFRQGGVLVRLLREGPDALALLPARGLDDATHQVVDACGLSLLTHLAERDPVFSGELMHKNCWEAIESLALLGVARPGMTVLDIGANVGSFATLLARALGPGPGREAPPQGGGPPPGGRGREGDRARTGDLPLCGYSRGLGGGISPTRFQRTSDVDFLQGDKVALTHNQHAAGWG